MQYNMYIDIPTAHYRTTYYYYYYTTLRNNIKNVIADVFRCAVISDSKQWINFFMGERVREKERISVKKPDLCAK